MPTFKNANLAQINYFIKIMNVTLESTLSDKDKVKKLIKISLNKNRMEFAKNFLRKYNDLDNRERQINLDIANLQRQKFRKTLSCK